MPYLFRIEPSRHPLRVLAGRAARFVPGLGTVLLIIALWGAGRVASAQATSTGTVGGIVTDSQTHVIVGGKVTLTSTQQGHAISVLTNRQGEFLFNAVPAGTYDMKVQAPTFSSYIITQITVDANANVTLDATLTRGVADASVTVTADSTTIDTRSATLGTVIDNNLVENLPLDGNNAIQLAAILPGVTDVNAPTTFTNNTAGPTYNISGSRNNQNLLLLDGAIWNNLYSNTGINFPPSQALSEVSVLTNGFKAQYGRNVGSVFNVLTRSGSNNFRGTLYEYVQNKFLNAYDYLSKQNPHLVQNQFGATLTGPLRRDKLFFALAYQDLRSSAAISAVSQPLSLANRGYEPDGVTPYPCSSTGLFPGMTCANFVADGGTINNPLTATNLISTSAAQVQNYVSALSAINTPWRLAGNAGNSPCAMLLLNAGLKSGSLGGEIPTICFNPVSVTFLQYMPVPSGSANGLTATQAKQPRNDQNGLVRIDWILPKHTIDARYYQTAADDRTANGVSGGDGIPNYDINHNLANIHFGGIGDTWVIKNNLLNVLRADYKRYVYLIFPTNSTTLAGLGSDFTQPGDNSLPAVSFNGRILSFGTTNNNNFSVDEGIELDDSITWTHGKHNTQFGVEFLRLQYLSQHSNEPSIGFSTDYTSDVAADYILGLISNSSFSNSTNQAAVQHDLYSYAQDDWRITSRLTLNLGIRYELPFQWYQPDGQAVTFIPGFQSSVFPSAPANLAFVGDPGVKRSLVGTVYHDVAPRFGFAYDVFGDGRTSIRGGAGIFYDAINALVVGVASPYHYTEGITQNPGGFSQPLYQEQPVPQNFVKGQAPPFVAPYTITFPDKNFGSPYTISTNLGFQQRIGKTSNLEVNYVGHLGRHLALGHALNPAIYDCTGVYAQINLANYCTDAVPNSVSYAIQNPIQLYPGYYNSRVVYPNFQNVTDYMTVGESNYHALQAVYTARSGKTLTTTVSYTYSKSMDDSSSTNIANTTDTPNVDAHYAPSDFNTKHILNIGWVLRYPDIGLKYRAARAVINGWAFNGIYNARTGHPFSLFSDQDTPLRNEYPDYLSVLPGYNGSITLPSNRHRAAKVQEWFNTASVVVPASCTGCVQAFNDPPVSYTFTKGSFGNVQRNSLVGPAFILTTLAVQRNFSLEHGRSFNFRMDAFNAFNTPNLGTPFNSLSEGTSKNTNFGQVTATVGNNGNAVTNGRRLQLSGTLRF